MKLVEVIRAADTAQWVVDAMVALGKRQTRVPVVVGDTPGFLVNLGGTAIGTEGLRIMQEGRATPSQVDAVMRDTCGFRMGPFELMDLTGIDVNFPARKIIYEGFFHDRRMTPSPYHESLYAAGKLGRKTGGGWYGYDEKGGKIDAGADHPTSHVPASSVVIMDTHNTKLMSLVNADGAKMLAADDGKSPILVAPIGKDCTTTAIELGLDPKRTVAVDLTGDVSKRITIMMAPGFDPAIRDATVALLAKSGTKVTVIKDSPGFIAQRMCSMIANLGCEMAMIGIASAADVDTAMTLGLNYPHGPLALADWLGVKECHEILVQIQAITGDDRYRPSQWLRRRAMLGLSATTVE
jgi:3-hydroxybutyryl-CoA dehydrogenase